jgi:hypothetical protein
MTFKVPVACAENANNDTPAASIAAIQLLDCMIFSSLIGRLHAVALQACATLSQIEFGCQQRILGK